MARALHENQSSVISHPMQYRNMPAVKLFTYPQNDSGVGNKCKSMRRKGEIWASASAPDVAQADSAYLYDGLVQLANYISLIVLCNVHYDVSPFVFCWHFCCGGQ